MDEADVFLEARDDHGDSNTRNALVAGELSSCCETGCLN